VNNVEDILFKVVCIAPPLHDYKLTVDKIYDAKCVYQSGSYNSYVLNDAGKYELFNISHSDLALGSQNYRTMLLLLSQENCPNRPMICDKMEGIYDY